MKSPRTSPLRPALAFALLLTGAFAAQVSAQSFDDTTISTDRPGSLYGTSIVPTDHLQLETGLPTFQNNGFAGGHSLLLSTPTYLRYGLNDRFELQLGGSPYNRQSVTFDGQTHSVSGLGDTQVGAKYALVKSSGSGPNVTLVGYVTVPTGKSEFSGGRPAYNLNAVAGWSLGDSNSLNTMVGYTRAPVGEHRHANTGIAAVSLGHGFTSRFSGYVEAVYLPGFSNSPDLGLAGAGATFLLAPHVQIDGFFDLGLNKASPNSSFGTGLSILF